MTTLYNIRTPVHDRAIGIEVEGFLLNDIFWQEYEKNNFSDFFGFFYAGSDVSIQRPRWDYKAVEFVSQPLSPAWLKKELGKLYKRFPIESNASCGIHVHVSKKWCTHKKAIAIAEFLAKALDDEDMLLLFGRKSNRYCERSLPISTTTKYRSINFTKDDTIEFRMFASGGVKWAQYCVDMVEYLVKNCYHLSRDGILAFRDMYRGI